MINLTQRTWLAACLLALSSPAVFAQKQPEPVRQTDSGSGGTVADNRVAIHEADIKRDLYKLADDHFQGRVAGSLNELKASAWIAEQLRAMGLQPAGDDGTYFQFFHIQRTRVSETSRFVLGTKALTYGPDVIALAPAIASVDAPLVYVGTGTPAEMANVDVKGKAVAILFSGNPPGDLSFRRFMMSTMNRRAAELVKAGAVATIFVSDDRAQAVYNWWSSAMEMGRYDLPGGPNTRVFSQAPLLWMPADKLPLVKQPNQQFTNVVNVESFSYPSVNIVAKLPGTDPKLRDENVLISTHQDHDGIRRAVAGDSIYNGADDNATGCAAALAIGRAFVQKPGKRSLLIVFHGAEERGLLGSRYFVEHPTVPKSSIVAVLNGEMMGRNNPDSAALLGSQLPHRNSLALVNDAMEANRTDTKFKLDTLWDRPDHPEGWYFRSDHLPYARAGIPAICFTTLLHPDYHTPRDEPARIDYAKLTRMTRWMYLTAWRVANDAEKPTVDVGFKLER